VENQPTATGAQTASSPSSASPGTPRTTTADGRPSRGDYAEHHRSASSATRQRISQPITSFPCPKIRRWDLSRWTVASSATRATAAAATGSPTTNEEQSARPSHAERQGSQRDPSRRPRWRAV